MKKSMLLASFIVVLCFSVLLTAPVAAVQGQEVEIQDKFETKAVYNLFLPFIIRETAPPKLVSPVNGSEIDTLLPVFVWEEMKIPDNTFMRIDISKNNDFSTHDGTAIHDEMNFGKTFLNLEPATLFYWRIYRYDYINKINYSYSEVWSFTTPSDGTLPDTPTLKSPTDESVIETGPIILECNEVSGAIEYQFWFQEMDASSISIAYSDIPKYTMEEYEISPGINYQWWVRAINEYGIGEASDAWSFWTANNYTSD